MELSLTQKNRETIDACRFCWMCRHICPIGNATGHERNTARARALAISVALRGSDILADIMDNIYECSLCRACTHECKTGWDPVAFVMETRFQAAIANALPPIIEEMVERIEKTGNIYGQTTTDDQLARAIDALPKQSDIIFYLGQDARSRNREGALTAIELLKKANLNFTVLTEEPDSGYAFWFLVGAVEEVRTKAKKTAQILGTKTVIVYDPVDAAFFRHEYREWNVGLQADIRTFTSWLDKMVQQGELHPKKGTDCYIFQDPPALARELEETEDARNILDACGSRKELYLHGADTVLAGNLIMNEYMPETMKLVARERWRQAKCIGADILVTASPSEYILLKENKPDGAILQTLEQVVWNQCKSM